MIKIIGSIEVALDAFLNSLGIAGPLFGCFLILVESMVPVLPLCVFITLNFYVFGTFMGFLISYVLTVIGCVIAFSLSRKFLNKFILNKRFGKKESKEMIKTFSNISVSNLATMMAFPFTPAFLINIFSGLSKMEFKNFLISCLIGKAFMVYFWGFIGTSFIVSFKSPICIVKITCLLIITFLVSKIVTKKFNLE